MTSPSACLDVYRADLEALRAKDRLRKLAPAAGVDFASNDYLGLAQSSLYSEAAQAALARAVPLGAGGSRLLRGNHAEFEALETEAARFFGAQSALFFGAGFAANEALLATAPQRGDLILFDALIHASAHEGMRLSRAASRAVRHNDVNAFAAALEAYRAEGGVGRPWLVVESLYSMDGDLRRSANSPRSQIGMTPFSSSTKRMRQASSGPAAAASRMLSRAATMSSRCTLAARRSASPAPCCVCRRRCARS